MNQFQSQNKNESGNIQELVQALHQSKQFNNLLKQKNDELTQNFEQINMEKEQYQKKYEEQQRTIKLLQEQNKQLQYKLADQEANHRKQVKDLQEDLKRVANENQVLIQKPNYPRIQNDNINSENVQDEFNYENRINQAKNFESSKPIFNKNINMNYGSNIGQGQSLGKDSQRIDNQNMNQKQVNSSRQIQNSEPIDFARGNFTFSRQNPTQTNSNPNLIGGNNFYSGNTQAHNSQQKISTALNTNNQNFNQGNESIQSSQNNYDQLRLNESNISTSNSRMELSPNNRYNGDNIANIKKKYEQNFLKISQSTNVFASIHSTSPQKTNCETITTSNTNQQEIIYPSQKGMVKADSKVAQRKKIQDEELNFTDEDEDEEEDSEGDEQVLDEDEIDDFQETNSYNQKKISPVSKQTPKNFEIKQNMNRSDQNSQNTIDSKLSNSYILNDDIKSEPTVHQQKQMTFGLTNSPSLNYYRSELKGATANFYDPKVQLNEELSNEQYQQYSQSNSILDTSQNKQQYQKIFTNDQKTYRQPVAQNGQGNLDNSKMNVSQGKSRKIFEQNPHMNYSNNARQIPIQLTQGVINHSPVQNIIQKTNSQISFNNNSIFENQHKFKMNTEDTGSNNQNGLQDNNHEQHSAYFDVANIVFNDNRSEQNYSQIIYSPDKNENGIVNGQFNSTRVLQSSNNIKQKIKRIPKDSQTLISYTSQSESSQSQIRELYPSQIHDKQDEERTSQQSDIFSSQRYNIQDSGSKIYQNVPLTCLPSEVGRKLVDVNVPNYNNLKKINNNNLIQTSIDSYGFAESMEPVQKVQIKSPKNMMDISKKNNYGDQTYSDYLIEQYVSKHNLIENFFILSADQTAIKERVMTQNEIQIVKAETMYCYPQLNDEIRQIEETIHQLAFPSGVQVQQKLKKESSSDLLQIIFQQKIDLRTDSFVFTIKTFQSYTKYDNSNKNSISTQKDIIDIINPNQLLYCICIKQKNFIDFGDSNQVSKSQKKLKKEFYYEVDTVYCIMTRLPHIQFFLEVIENILNLIKVKKSQKHQLSINNHYDLDLFFFKQIKPDIEDKLQEMIKSKIPLFNSKQFSLKKYSYDTHPLVLQMKDITHSSYIECQWSLFDTLSRFKDSQNFVKLYISLLLERSVVFVSKNRTLLSQFILLFHSILKPLKWTHPMIITLPKALSDYLHSPTPIIIGLNDTKKNLEAMKFHDRFSDQLNIVYLDDMTFFFISEPSDTKDESDFINILNSEIQEQFKKFPNKNPYLDPNQEQQQWVEIGNNILNLVQKQFQEHIVQHIPKQPMFRKDCVARNLDYSLIHQEIINTKNITDNFLIELFKTQNFAYYLEEYYGIV